MSALPIDQPAASATREVSAPYAKDDHVLLLPEHTYGMVPQVCYGKISRVELGRIGVSTKKLPNFGPTAVTVNTRVHKPVVVTKTEFSGAQTGLWLRKSVVTLSTEEHFHGQVVAYVNRPPKLVVRTRVGDLDMRPDEVSEIPGPLGLILFHANLSTPSWNIEEIYAAHDSILKRIKGSFPDTQPVNSRAAIFLDLTADPGNEPVSWINAITGVNRMCHPDHAIACLRWEDNMVEKPADIFIGPQWCADPEFAPRAARPAEAMAPPPRRVIHYQTKTRQESVSSGTATDQEEVKEEFEVESARSEDDHELEDHPDAYADAVDIDELLSDVASVNERMLADENELKQYANLSAVHETASVTRNKDLFYPTKEDMVMFRTTHHRRYHKLTIMHYMKVLMQDEDIPFLTYPAMMIDIVTGNFGLLGVTAADFRVITATARNEFQRVNRDGVRSYGSSAKHFDAEPVADLQDMARCFGNMSDYFQARGSPVTQKHFAAAQKFALSLTSDECNEADVVRAAVKWLDAANQKFMSCLGIDVEYGTVTHRVITASLKKTNPEFLRKLQVVINQRRSHPPASSKRKSEPTSEAKSANKKKPSASKPAKPHDRAVQDLVPKHNGKSVCLRNLSKIGCWSKVEGECVSDDRCHFVPEGTLPASLEKHLVAKGWGGISPKYPHLKP